MRPRSSVQFIFPDPVPRPKLQAARLHFVFMPAARSRHSHDRISLQVCTPANQTRNTARICKDEVYSCATTLQPPETLAPECSVPPKREQEIRFPVHNDRSDSLATLRESPSVPIAHRPQQRVLPVPHCEQAATQARPNNRAPTQVPLQVAAQQFAPWQTSVTSRMAFLLGIIARVESLSGVVIKSGS